MSRDVERRRFCFALLRVVAAIGLSLVTLPGCASKPKAPPKPPTIKALRLVHHLGGTHYRTLVCDGVCYQTFGSTLLVLVPGQVVPVRNIELGKPGEIGPAVNMIADESRQRLFIVIEDDEVVELSLATPQSPAITARMSAADLGVRPRQLSIAGGEVFVSGYGGVVRLSDGARFLPGDDEVGRVVNTAHGLVACIGRRVHRLEDRRYVGSASDLQPIPAPPDSQGGATLAFARQGEQGILVGLMSPDLRELGPLPAEAAAVPGQLRRMRIAGGRLWIVTDDAVTSFAIGKDVLSDPQRIDVLGARDVDPINANELAIVGTFGRCIHRLADQASPGAADNQPFAKVQREPGRLSQAMTDGQHILAGSREGLWMYLINSRVELTTRQFEISPPDSPKRAATVTAQAQIEADGRSVTLTQTVTAASGSTTDTYPYVETNHCIIYCVAAIDGDFWIGHERGITVVKSTLITPDAEADRADSRAATKRPVPDVVLGELRFAGPVRQIYPLLVGGGASFVSEFGGFGVAKFVDEPIPVAGASKN